MIGIDNRVRVCYTVSMMKFGLAQIGYTVKMVDLTLSNNKIIKRKCNNGILS